MTTKIFTIITLLACFTLGCISYAQMFDNDFLNIIYEYFFVLFFAITLVFYLPLGLVYLIRKKKTGNIENLKRCFRAVNWLAIVVTLGFAFWLIFSLNSFWRYRLVYLLPFATIPLLFYLLNIINKNLGQEVTMDKTKSKSPY